MTTSKEELNPSLCRYNARKRQLQSSMLEYTERFRSVHVFRDGDLKTTTNNYIPPLEIQARRKFITRHSDTGPLLKRLNHGHTTLPRRPLSLDDKLLLNNKDRKTSVVTSSSYSRDTRSEYRSPTTTTNSSLLLHPKTAPLTSSGPPNSPDSDKSNNVRVSFVCASDLYDLVDFGGQKSPLPRHSHHHNILSSSSSPSSSFPRGVANLKTINEHPTTDRVPPAAAAVGRERKSAWSVKRSDKENNGVSSSTQRKDHNNSNSTTNNNNNTNKRSDGTRDNVVPDGFITGTSVKYDSRTAIKVSTTINDPDVAPIANNNNDDDRRQKRSAQFTNKTATLPVIKSSNGNEVYPLNISLEKAAAAVFSGKVPLNKLRQRPKRAKRMQLHKPDLVSIPEDGHGQQGHHHHHHHSVGVSVKDEQQRQGEIMSSSGKEADIFEERNSYNDSDNSIGNDNNSNSNDKNNTVTQKKLQKKQRQIRQRENACKHLDSVILKNNIYPVLPWENDATHPSNATTGTSTVMNLDFLHDTDKPSRKVKRLVFLRDQSQDA